MHHKSLTAITQAISIFVFLLLITLSPSFHFIPYIEFHDCQRIIQLLLLAVVLLDAMTISFNPSLMLPIHQKIRLSLFTIAVLAAAASYFALASRYAAIEISIFAALCYLALLVARLFNARKDVFIQYLSYALWASVVLYIVAFYVGYATAIAFGKQLVWPMPLHGFSNVRLFQQYQLWGMGLICLPLLAFNLQQKIKNMLYVALAFWWVLLFYAASRGVTLGWILAMIATAIVYKKQAWSFLRVQLYTAIVGLILFFLLFHVIPTLNLGLATDVASTANAATGAAGASDPVVFRTIFRDTTYDRLDLWKVAYVMIKNFPILGVGPMNFYFYNSFGTHPHNSVLQIAAEWGLPATLIILAILGYMAKCWFRQFGPSGLSKKLESDKLLAIILFFTMVANGAYSLVEGVIVMPISQVLMFTMIGLMIGQYTSGSWFTAAPTPPRKFYFRPIIAALTLGFMLWSVMPELTMGLTSYQRYYEPGDRAFALAPHTINPRIWMQQRRQEAQKPAN